MVQKTHQNSISWQKKFRDVVRSIIINYEYEIIPFLLYAEMKEKFNASTMKKMLDTFSIKFSALANFFVIKSYTDFTRFF